MSHITILMMQILMNVAQNSITPEIGQNQSDFVKYTRTKNPIVMIKMISESPIQIYKGVNFCLINTPKAFDEV